MAPITTDRIVSEITSRDFLMGFSTGMLSNILCGVLIVLIMKAKK